MNTIKLTVRTIGHDEPDKTYHDARGRRCRHNVTIYQ